MRLPEALRKYSGDQYKRSELVKGKLVVRRIPHAFSKQGFIETYLSSTLSDHVGRYGLGRISGTVGYLIDPEQNAPTLRSAAITFSPAEREIQTGEGDFVITPPDLAIEFINQPEVKSGKDPFPLPLEHENEDSDNYWPTKLEDYRQFGVGLVWLIDLSAEEVHEFRKPEWQARTFRKEDSLESGEYLPGFRGQVADLFDLKKLGAGVGMGWEAPLDVELVEYIAARHHQAGLVRKDSVAEIDLRLLRLNSSVTKSDLSVAKLQERIAELERQIKEITG
jgi:Uma2 family endonuclease